MPNQPPPPGGLGIRNQSHPLQSRVRTNTTKHLRLDLYLPRYMNLGRGRGSHTDACSRGGVTLYQRGSNSDFNGTGCEDQPADCRWGPGRLGLRLPGLLRDRWDPSGGAGLAIHLIFWRSKGWEEIRGVVVVLLGSGSGILPRDLRWMELHLGGTREVH